MYNKISEYKRKVYDKTLYQKEFLNWQKQIIHKIYEDLIVKKNNELRSLYVTSDFVPTVSFTELDFGIKGSYTYESITLNLKPVDFPFIGVCSKEQEFLKYKEDITKEEYPIRQKNITKLQEQYYQLIKQSVRYPKRLGYMLDDILFDTADSVNRWYLKSYVGTYENNLKTSHILEYELYQLYQNNKRYNWQIEQADKETILQNLPIRKYIHDQFGTENEQNILTSGKYRTSLLGVQMFVLIKNFNGSYDVLRIRRANNVATKPGFLQFIPSGGFEALNEGTDFDTQRANYSLTKTLYRELVEECFGQDEDDKKYSGVNISTEKIYYNKHIRSLINMLTSKEPVVQMQLMGTTMNLVSLRHELSFILRIDDYEFASNFIGNNESKFGINLIDIKCLENRDFWLYDDLEKLNCTSAGLFELARKSEIYKKCI